ncbi:hypothetical protein SAMN05443579_11611 [Variovorax sp. PDC80]|nr:hypothetical protein SAMN05443579_11611 [Variovorax sp. PDC80]
MARERQAARAQVNNNLSHHKTMNDAPYSPPIAPTAPADATRPLPLSGWDEVGNCSCLDHVEAAPDPVGEHSQEPHTPLP